MKYFLILTVILFSCASNQSYLNQNNRFIPTGDNYIEVRIDDGAGSFGYCSAYLMYDGFLYSSATEAYFIRRKDINSNLLSDFQEFLNKNKPISNFESSTIPDSIRLPFKSPPTRIFLIDSDRNTNLIFYEKCDKKIDIIIDYINSLIPEKHRNKVYFIKRC